ncbi:hypothetical protein CMQ_1145 [Grosmannia clavigera kw1407]|uniref:Aminodeoxychorismate lyase n=1 Tax=Grosmannia clavigera (strain kw1407 / UAMH 11150) TaxID=655863 RepID=F0XFM7_GROCL|nr:uncharacterized protein CMQ_1145 [Grosmannia clavigera kw1407]EFX04217.1 hypothetical protein CMQ_1145 [Grosmannia clavigera kw1407]
MPDDSSFELFSSVRYDDALRDLPQKSAFAYGGWNTRQSSPFYMLDFHRDRLLRAAEHWEWEDAAATITGDDGLQRLERVLQSSVDGHTLNNGDGPLRCRVALNMNGRLHCSVFAAQETALVGLVPPQLPPPGFMASSCDGKGETQLLFPLLRSLRSELGPQPYEVSIDLDGIAASAYTHYKTTRRQMYDDARQRAGITGPEQKEVLLINAESGMIMDGSISTVYFWRHGRWVTPPVPSIYDRDAGSGGLDGTTRRWALEHRLAVQEEVKAASVLDGEECWLSNGVRGFLYGKIKIL